MGIIKKALLFSMVVIFVLSGIVSAETVEFDNFGFRKNFEGIEELKESTELKALTDNWEELPSEYEVPRTKAWTLEFSREYEEEEVAGMVIERENEFIPVNIELFPDKKEASIEPKHYYERDQKYTLKIFLENENRYYMDFYTKDKELEEDEKDTYNDLPLKENVDPYEPNIDLTEHDIKTENISGISLEKDGEFLSVGYEFKEDEVNLKTDDFDFVNVLEPNEDYQLKLYLEDGERYLQEIKTTGLPNVADTGEKQIVYIPPMPDKGFNYPYFLHIPDNSYKGKYENKERYLLVEPNNTGLSDSFETTLLDTRQRTESGTLASSLSRDLWLPKLKPVFPRQNIGMGWKKEFYYTHSLDRLSVYHTDDRVDELLEDERFITGNIENGSVTEEDLRKLVRVDKQLEKMIDHVIDYLNEYDHDLHEEKIFMHGFSAAGDFTNRWAALYPHRVKAVASGGINSQVILPAEEAEGEDLIYPIGVSDYKEITGREFDINQYNQVANFIYQGEEDTNDTFGFNDAFGPEETRLISEVLDENMYPDRWERTKEIFFDNGGKANFAIYKGVGHRPRPAIEDIINFYNANRDSDDPVYPSAENPNEVIFDKGD